MKRTVIAAMILILAANMTACVNKEAKKSEDTGSAIETPSVEASSVEASSVEASSIETASTEISSSIETPSLESTSAEASSETAAEAADDSGKITNDQALEAIKNYCIKNNPDLEGMINSNDYTINWDIESSDEKQIVVLYRSYTAALIRYYIDPTTGETYVTEFVPGITEEEERTDESFNLKDFL